MFNRDEFLVNAKAGKYNEFKANIDRQPVFTGDKCDAAKVEALLIACKELASAQKPDQQDKRKGLHKIIRYLIEAKTNLNIRDANKHTPLMYLILALDYERNICSEEMNLATLLLLEGALPTLVEDEKDDALLPSAEKIITGLLAAKSDKPEALNILKDQFEWIEQYRDTFSAEKRALEAKDLATDAITNIQNPLWGTPNNFAFLSTKLLNKSDITLEVYHEEKEEKNSQTTPASDEKLFQKKPCGLTEEKVITLIKKLSQNRKINSFFVSNFNINLTKNDLTELTAGLKELSDSLVRIGFSIWCSPLSLEDTKSKFKDFFAAIKAGLTKRDKCTLTVANYTEAVDIPVDFSALANISVDTCQLEGWDPIPSLQFIGFLDLYHSIKHLRIFPSGNPISENESNKDHIKQLYCDLLCKFSLTSITLIASEKIKEDVNKIIQFNQKCVDKSLVQKQLPIHAKEIQTIIADYVINPFEIAREQIMKGIKDLVESYPFVNIILSDKKNSLEESKGHTPIENENLLSFAIKNKADENSAKDFQRDFLRICGIHEESPLQVEDDGFIFQIELPIKNCAVFLLSKYINTMRHVISSQYLINLKTDAIWIVEHAIKSFAKKLDGIIDEKDSINYENQIRCAYESIVQLQKHLKIATTQELEQAVAAVESEEKSPPYIETIRKDVLGKIDSVTQTYPSAQFWLYFCLKQYYDLLRLAIILFTDTRLQENLELKSHEKIKKIKDGFIFLKNIDRKLLELGCDKETACRIITNLCENDDLFVQSMIRENISNFLREQINVQKSHSVEVKNKLWGLCSAQLIQSINANRNLDRISFYVNTQADPFIANVLNEENTLEIVKALLHHPSLTTIVVHLFTTETSPALNKLYEKLFDTRCTKVITFSNNKHVQNNIDNIIRFNKQNETKEMRFAAGNIVNQINMITNPYKNFFQLQLVSDSKELHIQSNKIRHQEDCKAIKNLFELIAPHSTVTVSQVEEEKSKQYTIRAPIKWAQCVYFFLKENIQTIFQFIQSHRINYPDLVKFHPLVSCNLPIQDVLCYYTAFEQCVFEEYIFTLNEFLQNLVTPFRDCPFGAFPSEASVREAVTLAQDSKNSSSCLTKIRETVLDQNNIDQEIEFYVLERNAVNLKLNKPYDVCQLARILFAEPMQQSAENVHPSIHKLKNQFPVLNEFLRELDENDAISATGKKIVLDGILKDYNLFYLHLSEFNRSTLLGILKFLDKKNALTVDMVSAILKRQNRMYIVWEMLPFLLESTRWEVMVLQLFKICSRQTFLEIEEVFDRHFKLVNRVSPITLVERKEFQNILQRKLTLSDAIATTQIRIGFLFSNLSPLVNVTSVPPTPSPYAAP